jgi:hypothetical protein
MTQHDSTPISPKLKLLGREIPLPRSRPVRVGIAVFLIVFGALFGWLPVLGYWMVPVGLFILAHDSPRIRRWNRRLGVWIRRKMRGGN